jgi:hypothetical protein
MADSTLLTDAASALAGVLTKRLQGDDRAGGAGEPERTKHQQERRTGHKSTFVPQYHRSIRSPFRLIAVGAQGRSAQMEGGRRSARSSTCHDG